MQRDRAIIIVSISFLLSVLVDRRVAVLRFVNLAMSNTKSHAVTQITERGFTVRAFSSLQDNALDVVNYEGSASSHSFFKNKRDCRYRTSCFLNSI